MADMREFSSRAYWETRYRAGGTSGAGSAGRLAHYKAAVINSFIAENDIRGVIDFGCGDASQLALLRLPVDYIGVDVSADALARCAARFPAWRFVPPEELSSIAPADLTLSMDVIYHLVEDAVFAEYARSLFVWATRFVLIYASNVDAAWSSAHVRHRNVTAHVTATQPGWRLLAHLPNPYPFDPSSPDTTTFADFYIFGRADAPCSIVVPASA